MNRLFSGPFSTHSQRVSAWERAERIPGCDKAVWRLDADGRVIRWDDYGDRFSQYGWLIHADPRAHWLAKALGVAAPAPLHWRGGGMAA